MKLLPKPDKNLDPPQKSLPNEFIDYLSKPRQFSQTLFKYKPKNVNPLYSKQSMIKYFGHKKQQKYKQPAEHLVVKKDKPALLSQSIIKFNELKQKLKDQSRMSRKRKLAHEVEGFASNIEKQFQHFDNLNWDDGINPLNQFSICNLKLKDLIQKLQNQKIDSRHWRYKKERQIRLRIHTENIIDSIKKQEYESRYKKVPVSSVQIEEKKQIQSFQRSNKSLRSKTMYCRSRYNPPYLKWDKIDTEILTQSRKYMEKNRTIRSPG